jgi:hypothetical protein
VNGLPGGTPGRGQNSLSLASVLGNFLLIPFATLSYAMGLIAENARDMRTVTSHGIEVILGGGEPPGNTGSEPAVVSIVSGVGYGINNTPSSRERTIRMSTYEVESRVNKDLHDDMLKLVRSKILFVKREYEVAFREHEDLVSDNMDGTAFTAWKAAEFIQSLERGDTDVPHRWRDKNYPPGDCTSNGKLKRLPEDDKKYLRVYYEVLDRYPREKFRYEENQIRVLEQIRDKMA